MVKAVYNGKVIAESAETLSLEGTDFFPRETVQMSHLSRSPTRTSCPWRGVANYYHVEVDGKIETDAAYSYEAPKKRAARLKNHIAFWKGVETDKGSH